MHTCVSGCLRDCKLSDRTPGSCPDSPVTNTSASDETALIAEAGRTNATGAAPAGLVEYP